MTRSAILAATLCMVLTSTAALATDGVIEINQSRAIAGSITPGDLADFPITITQSGSYRLTSNLTIASTTVHVIVVIAPNVTIDLNGFTIAGPNTCTAGTPTTCAAGSTGDGVFATAESVTVRNGAITGMGHDGVELAAFSRVENVRVSQSGSIGISVNQSSVIIGCISAVNGNTGIAAFNANSLILNSTAVSNALQGFLANGTGGVISDCTARANGASGISLAQDNLVTRSTATANTGAGLAASSGSAYSNCVFAGNNGANPEVTGGVQIGTNICNGAACP